MSYATNRLGDVGAVYHEIYCPFTLARSAYAEWAMVRVCDLTGDDAARARYQAAAIDYAERAGCAAHDHGTYAPALFDGLEILSLAWEDGYAEAEGNAEQAARIESEREDAAARERTARAIAVFKTGSGIGLFCLQGNREALTPPTLANPRIDEVVRKPLEIRAIDGSLIKAWPAPADGWTQPEVFAILDGDAAKAVVRDVTEAYIGDEWIGGTEL
jgi:hypothetical protein